MTGVKICLSLKTVCCSLLPCSHTGSYRINPNTSEFQLPLAVQRMTPTKASGWGMVILQPSNDPRTKSSPCRTSGPYLYSLRENYHKLHSNLGYSVRMSQNKTNPSQQSYKSPHRRAQPLVVGKPFLTLHIFLIVLLIQHGELCKEKNQKVLREKQRCRNQVRSQEEAKINQRQERWVGKHGDAHL